MILSKLALSVLFGLLIASDPIVLDQQSKPFTNSASQMSTLASDATLKPSSGIQKHDPIRLKVMTNVLEENPINMPLVLIKEIEEYNFNKPISDLHEKIMHKLKVSSEEWANFSFYEKDFANLLIRKFATIQDDFDEEDSIWSSIRRILFKWLLYMNEPENRKDLDGDALECIRNIDSLLPSQPMSDFPKNFDFLSMNRNTRDRFANLLDCEFIEEGIPLFSTFSSLLDNFYLKKIGFEELINKYFGGAAENNLLLKFMIIAHDPIGDLAKNFPESKKRPFSNRSKLDLIEITPEYLRDISLKGPKTLEISNMNDLSETILKFHSTTGRFCDFSIDTIGTAALLESLEENKFLTREMLESMFRFPFYNGDTSEPYPEWHEYRLEQIINTLLFTPKEDEEKNIDLKTLYKSLNLIIDTNVLNDLFQRVMNRLGISHEEGGSLGFRFRDQEFPKTLYRILLHQNEIPPLDLFWHDLRRLLFKWVIFTKSCSGSGLEIMKAFAILIEEKSGIALPTHLNPKTMELTEMFSLEELMNHELLENRHYIGSFVSAVDAFYNKKIGCERLMEVLGFNGHDAETVSTHLKFMILKYDSLGEMQKCFLKDDEIGILGFNSRVKIDLNNLTTLEEEIFNDLEVNDFGYLSTSTIKLYLKLNRRFLPWNSRDLPILQEKLKGIGLWNLSTLNAILGSQYFLDNPDRQIREWYLAQIQTSSSSSINEAKKEDLKSE